MFGLLLESRARRARRTGGAALSVAVHTAIIGVAAALTAHGKGDRPAPEQRLAILRYVAPRPPILERTPAARVLPVLRGPSFGPRTVSVPPIVPTSLPAIDLSAGIASDSVVISSGPSGKGNGTRTNSLDLGADESSKGGALTGIELVMRIVRSAKPRYPESLRQAGIGGHVLVRFTVDTLGSIDMSSVQVLDSTHDGFSRSVRDALPLFRFKPSEVGGHRVRALAEMPFEFTVSR